MKKNQIRFKDLSFWLKAAVIYVFVEMGLLAFILLMLFLVLLLV